MEILISFLGGAVVAAIVVALIFKSRMSQAVDIAKAGLEADFKSKLAKSDADLAHAEKDAEGLRSMIEQERVNANAKVAEVKADMEKRNNESLEALEKKNREMMAALQEKFNETIGKVTAQVKADTNDMLKASQKEFAESSNQSIGQILNPLKENIAQLKVTMENGSTAQAKMHGEIEQQIKGLMEFSDATRKSADELAAAFRHGSKIQGDWGEIQLKNLLETQGLKCGIHFDIQPTLRDQEGKALKSEDGNLMRPDVILHLDQRREVIIDSKVSLTAFANYVNADNDIDKERYLKEHIASIKRHVDELAKKDYSKYVVAPKISAGYVIMFVPHAGALWTALNAEPGLWRDAADKNVCIADEQSLYGALKMVSLTWTQIAQANNHAQVYALASEIINRLGMFLENYKKVGDSIQNALNSYVASSKKLKGGSQSVFTTASQLVKLGAKNDGKHQIPEEFIDIDEIPALEESADNQSIEAPAEPKSGE